MRSRRRAAASSAGTTSRAKFGYAACSTPTRKAVWINPVPEKYWSGTASIGMIRQIIEDRMFPLTLDGLDQGMRRLTRSSIRLRRPFSPPSDAHTR